MDTQLHQHISVALADSRDMCRSGLKCWLQKEPDITVIAEAGNTADLLEAVRTSMPDVVVLNMTLAERTALDIVSLLRKEGNRSKIVVIGTDYSSIASIINKTDAHAYIQQDEKREVFISAVRHVVRHSDNVWLSPSAKKLQQDIANELKELAFTPMEKKILSHIDNNNQEIAQRLNLAVGTVRNHISNVYFRLNVPGRKEAIEAARRLGLIGT